MDVWECDGERDVSDMPVTVSDGVADVCLGVTCTVYNRLILQKFKFQGGLVVNGAHPP